MTDRRQNDVAPSVDLHDVLQLTEERRTKDTGVYALSRKIKSTLFDGET